MAVSLTSRDLRAAWATLQGCRGGARRVREAAQNEKGRPEAAFQEEI
jgi:hypothetical protein